MSEEKESAEMASERETEAGGGRRKQRAREAEQSAALEARVRELESALAEKEQQAAEREKEAREYLEGWQRERAGFENYRKRIARELDDAGVIAKAELVRAILPAVDNLERALEDATPDVEVVRKGVRMTYDQMVNALAQQGVKPVPSVGEPFDPNLHEAVGVVEETEYAPDTVAEDLQKGYTLGERLVRPARVRVAR